MSYVHTAKFEEDLNDLRVRASVLELALLSPGKISNSLRRDTLAQVAGEIARLSEAVESNILAHNNHTRRLENTK